MNAIWIDKEYKGLYKQELSKDGIRLFIDNKISSPVRIQIIKFIRFLRKNYYFPIRCKIYLCERKNFTSKDGKKRIKGIFFQGEIDKKTFPQIYVPCKTSKYWEIQDIYLSIVRLLTFYFQWYFFEDEKRSNRSLEIEATKYAYAIVFQYLNS